MYPTIKHFSHIEVHLPWRGEIVTTESLELNTTILHCTEHIPLAAQTPIFRECHGLCFSRKDNKLISRPYHTIDRLSEIDVTSIPETGDYSVVLAPNTDQSQTIVQTLPVPGGYRLIEPNGPTEESIDAENWIRTTQARIDKYVWQINKLRVENCTGLFNWDGYELILLDVRDNETGWYWEYDMPIFCKLKSRLPLPPQIHSSLQNLFTTLRDSGAEHIVTFNETGYRLLVDLTS